MKKPLVIIFSGILSMLIACNGDERQHELDMREQALLQKENAFALKEADYQSLIKMRDSLLARKDTVADTTVYTAWPASVLGTWNSKVICTASDCNDYIVGDQRTDTWSFISDSSQMITKISSNNKLVRIYLGNYDGQQVKLHFATDSTSPKHVVMDVLLNDISPEKMRGTRTILIDSSCTAKFSIELNKIASE